MNSIFLENLHHSFAQTDGTYRFPNSLEGDLLKQAKKEIEQLLKKQPPERPKLLMEVFSEDF